MKLAANRYGKARVRLMKVTRHDGVHELREWTVRVLLEGDFDSAHLEGDNSRILPTDTMKNTVYSRAKESSAESMEEFAEELIAFLLRRNQQVSAVEVKIESVLWKRLTVDGEPHPNSFMRGSDEVQTVLTRRTKSEQTSSGEHTSQSGLSNLVILKTAKSGFEGYIKDELTTLRETSDRLFGTAITADWIYSTETKSGFNELREHIREVMLKAFTEHDSKSVQQTLYAMAEAALNAIPELVQVHMVMPNKHCLLVDLNPFGQENANEIFVPIEDPHGYIEATVTRG